MLEKRISEKKKLYVAGPENLQFINENSKKEFSKISKIIQNTEDKSYRTFEFLMDLLTYKIKYDQSFLTGK